MKNSIAFMFLLLFLLLSFNNLYSKHSSKNKIEEPDTTYFQHDITVADDNGDSALPKVYRTWWADRFDAPTDKPTKINIIGDGWAGKSYVVPVYSYDNKYWHRFLRDSIDSDKGKNGMYNYSVTQKFDSSKVWVARYYPYPLLRLENLIEKHKSNKYLKVETIGKTALGRPFKMLVITDPKIPLKDKKCIWIHARTHPSETGGSYAVEGLIDFLLSKCNADCEQVNLKQLAFFIVPIVNIDGVEAGNSRVTPKTGYDLERQWLFKDTGDSMLIRDSCALETREINLELLKLIKSGASFIASINIHTSNAGFEARPFIFSNFSKWLPEHGDSGDTLFEHHLQMASLITKYNCDTVVVRTSYYPKMSMEKKIFIESWWWINFKAQVNAFTLELTNRNSGCFEDLVNYRDHIMLGESLAKATQKYYEYYYLGKWEKFDAPKGMKELKKFIKGGEGD